MWVTGASAAKFITTLSMSSATSIRGSAASLTSSSRKPRVTCIAAKVGLVQADVSNETQVSVVICPIASFLVAAPLFRLPPALH